MLVTIKSGSQVKLTLIFFSCRSRSRSRFLRRFSWSRWLYRSCSCCSFACAANFRRGDDVTVQSHMFQLPVEARMCGAMRHAAGHLLPGDEVLDAGVLGGAGGLVGRLPLGGLPRLQPGLLRIRPRPHPLLVPALSPEMQVPVDGVCFQHLLGPSWKCGRERRPGLHHIRPRPHPLFVPVHQTWAACCDTRITPKASSNSRSCLKTIGWSTGDDSPFDFRLSEHWAWSPAVFQAEALLAALLILLLLDIVVSPPLGLNLAVRLQRCLDARLSSPAGLCILGLLGHCRLSFCLQQPHTEYCSKNASQVLAQDMLSKRVSSKNMTLHNAALCTYGPDTGQHLLLRRLSLLHLSLFGIHCRLLLPQDALGLQASLLRLPDPLLLPALHPRPQDQCQVARACAALR